MSLIRKNDESIKIKKSKKRVKKLFYSFFDMKIKLIILIKPTYYIKIKLIHF